MQRSKELNGYANPKMLGQLRHAIRENQWLKKIRLGMTDTEKGATVTPVDQENAEEPKDKYYIVHFVFFMMGLAMVLPINFFVTANAYWMYKFRNTTTDEVDSEHRTGLQTQFMSALYIVVETASVVFLFVAFLFASRFPVRFLVVGCLATLLALFTFSTVFIEVDTDSWQVGFFAMTLVIVAAINATVATMGISFISLVSLFPVQYLRSFLNGQQLATVFAAVVSVLSLTLDMSALNNAWVYFGIGIFTLVFTVILATLATRYNKFLLHKLEETENKEKERIPTFSEILDLFKGVWPCIVMVIFYAVTVIPVHPSITSLVVSEGEGTGKWSDVYFVPVITHLVGAVANLIGRYLTSVIKINISMVWWITLCALRLVVFVPLLMLCNEQPRHHLPVVFHHDYEYMIILLVYQVTNGYFWNILYVNVSKLAKPEKLKRSYQVVALSVGISQAAFSYLSLALIEIL